MKKSLISVFLLIGFTTMIYFSCTSLKDSDSNTKLLLNSYNSTESVDKKLYNDALSAFLQPHIHKAIDDWSNSHPEYFGGTVDPWNTKILSVTRIPDQTKSQLWFLIKVEVMPYILAHISVGRDHITFMLSPSGEVTLEKLERIESYDEWKKRLPQSQ